jgi:hypothetical protein
VAHRAGRELVTPRSLDGRPDDGGWLGAGKEPGRCGDSERHADDCEGEPEDRHMAEIAEVVVVQRRLSPPHLDREAGSGG